MDSTGRRNTHHFESCCEHRIHAAGIVPQEDLSRSQKLAFLTAYDRLEKVADAARGASVTTMAGYRWLVDAGSYCKRMC